MPRALSVRGDGLGTDIGVACARYYERNRNSASLQGYGAMLKKLVRGRMLSPASSERLFAAMEYGRRGTYRLEARLPARASFTHKTGTQYQRACHVGVVQPERGGADGVVLAVCAAELDEQVAAGRLFAQVGQAVAWLVLAPTEPNTSKEGAGPCGASHHDTNGYLVRA